MKYLMLLVSIFLISSCRTTVNPNEWVVSTATCWNTMSVTKAGSPIPRTLTNCDRVVVLPASTLNGEVEVECKFGSQRTKGKLKLTYSYYIDEPILFLQNAKFITSAPTLSDNKVDPNVLENAENTVIDKLAADIIREFTPKVNPLDVDELEVEKGILPLLLPYFKAKGLRVENPSVDINFSPQTEEAIDVISAFEMYKAEGLEELGKDVIKNKASKPNIVISPSTTIEAKKE